MDCNLAVKLKSPASRKAFMEEFRRSNAVHGESYDIVETGSLSFNLKLKPNAPKTAGIPLVYMDLQDFVTLWKDPQGQNSEGQSSKVEYGVYNDPQTGELWIDGSWLNAYGAYQKDERNDRVEAAQIKFPTANIHLNPTNIQGWNIVG